MQGLMGIGARAQFGESRGMGLIAQFQVPAPHSHFMAMKSCGGRLAGNKSAHIEAEGVVRLIV